jgi:hypothetical protein
MRERTDLVEGFWDMGAASTELVYVERLIHHRGISMGVRVRAKIIRVVK